MVFLSENNVQSINSSSNLIPFSSAKLENRADWGTIITVVHLAALAFILLFKTYKTLKNQVLPANSTSVSSSQEFLERMHTSVGLIHKCAQDKSKELTSLNPSTSVSRYEAIVKQCPDFQCLGPFYRSILANLLVSEDVTLRYIVHLCSKQQKAAQLIIDSGPKMDNALQIICVIDDVWKKEYLNCLNSLGFVFQARMHFIHQLIKSILQQKIRKQSLTHPSDFQLLSARNLSFLKKCALHAFPEIRKMGESLLLVYNYFHSQHVYANSFDQMSRVAFSIEDWLRIFSFRLACSDAPSSEEWTFKLQEFKHSSIVQVTYFLILALGTITKFCSNQLKRSFCEQLTATNEFAKGFHCLASLWEKYRPQQAELYERVYREVNADLTLAPQKGRRKDSLKSVCLRMKDGFWRTKEKEGCVTMGLKNLHPELFQVYGNQHDISEASILFQKTLTETTAHVINAINVFLRTWTVKEKVEVQPVDCTKPQQNSRSQPRKNSRNSVKARKVPAQPTPSLEFIDEVEETPEMNLLHNAWRATVLKINYHARLIRWFELRPGQAYDFKGYMGSVQYLEKMRLKHGFTPVVDRVMCIPTHCYTPSEKNAYAIAQFTFPDGSRERGVIEWGLYRNKNGGRTCFHRFFNPKSDDALIHHTGDVFSKKAEENEKISSHVGSAWLNNTDANVSYDEETGSIHFYDLFNRMTITVFNLDNFRYG